MTATRLQMIRTRTLYTLTPEFATRAASTYLSGIAGLDHPRGLLQPVQRRAVARSASAVSQCVWFLSTFGR